MNRSSHELVDVGRRIEARAKPVLPLATLSELFRIGEVGRHHA